MENNMQKLSVRSLLMESKVSDNLSSQLERLQELSGSLKELSKNCNTLNRLTEDTSVQNLNKENIQECSRLFVEARKNLAAAKKSTDMNDIYEHTKLAYNCMNDIEDIKETIECSMHDALDAMENAQ